MTLTIKLIIPKFCVFFLNSHADKQNKLTMSLFLGHLVDAPSTKFTRIIIEDAKDNWKYRRGKPKSKYQRRVRDPDVEQFYALARENGINMGYDETCDTIWFETRVEGEDILLSGKDTGGQFIRTMIQIAVNSGEGRQVPLAPVTLPQFLEKDRIQVTKTGKEIRKNGKSNMLVGVQMRMYTMRVGDTITIDGGDPFNDDALAWDKHAELFRLIKSVFGYVYTLDNKTGDIGVAKFTLTRLEDTEPDTDIIDCDIHTADQLLMAFMGHRTLNTGGKLVNYEEKVKESLRKVTLNFPLARDYHPEAMIYALGKFGFKLEDSKIDAGVGETNRTVCVYI